MSQITRYKYRITWKASHLSTLTFRFCNSSSFYISHLGGRRKSIACRQKTDSGRENPRSWSLKSILTACKRSKLNLWRLWNTLCERYEAKKKTPKNVSYLPPMRHTSPTQDLLPERFTAFTPLCLPNPKQAKGHWEVTTFLPPIKSTTFPTILTRFIQIWTKFTQFFI